MFTFSLCNLTGSTRILAEEVHGLNPLMLPGSLLPSENESLGTRLGVSKGGVVGEQSCHVETQTQYPLFG